MRRAGQALGVAAAIASSALTWQLAVRADYELHPFMWLQVPAALLVLFGVGHREGADYIPLFAALAFVVGFGWYFLMNPAPAFWIGAANLAYLPAWWLASHDAQRESPTTSRGAI